MKVIRRFSRQLFTNTLENDYGHKRDRECKRENIDYNTYTIESEIQRRNTNGAIRYNCFDATGNVCYDKRQEGFVSNHFNVILKKHGKYFG